MSKLIQTDNGYKLDTQPIAVIEDQCQYLANYIKRNRELGYDYDALYVSDDDLKRRMCEHLNVSETPMKGFQARLFNALMDKYGKQV